MTEDIIVAPLSMKVSPRSLDPSQNSSLMDDTFFKIFFVVLRDSTKLPAIVQLMRKHTLIIPSLFFIKP